MFPVFVNVFAAGALPRTALGELTALPGPLAGLEELKGKARTPKLSLVVAWIFTNPSHQTADCFSRLCILIGFLCYAKDTRTRNRYRKPVPENLYQFSAGVSCESVSIFSGTEIWYGVEHCSTPYQI